MYGTDPDLKLETLLPLKAFIVTLQFTRAAQPKFFHQAAIHAFIRHLLRPADNIDQYLRLDACESSRVQYQQGDYYRFQIIGLKGSDALLEKLLHQLQHLPDSARALDQKTPFNNNLKYLQIIDAFSEQAVETLDDLSPYTLQSLEQETQQWLSQTELNVKWLSPARLKKTKQTIAEQQLKGEQRYCRDQHDIAPDTWCLRVHDAIATLLRKHQETTSQRPAAPLLSKLHTHVFWVDSYYTDAKGNKNVMGGMTGLLHMGNCQELSPAWWRLLVLGQYTGIGERPVFGWGRYQLNTTDGGHTVRRAYPANSMLQLACQAENLSKAWQHVMANTEQHLNEYQEDEEHAETTPQAPISQLNQAFDDMIKGDYAAPPLHGHLIPKKDGNYRPLAVPNVFDRTLQRALSQVLSPSIDQIMYERSYGYRSGRSRIAASHAIQNAYREGYRWVYESDIKDFFDSVNWQRLQERLQGLFPDNALINALMQWMQADVIYQGERLQRQSGLPQGSPLSPLLANLILDDFDSDMQTAGFRLIRFADDFVILCKSAEQAKAAGEAAVASLQEHELQLNPEKTRITAMDEGFRYLGYLFVNDMALDVSGQQQPNNINAENIPKNWLTTLAEKQALPLQADDTLENLLKQLAKQETVSVGDSDQLGACLCITGDPGIITTRAKHLRFIREDKILLDIPWLQIQTVIVFGPHQITTQAMQAAMQAQVPIHLANIMGMYQGSVVTGKAGQAGHQLWLHQLARLKNVEHNLEHAKSIVMARIRHQKEVLRTRVKNWDNQLLGDQLNHAQQAQTLDQLRGHEGMASKRYFQHLAENMPEAFAFEGRNRRPPTDPFNALLSLGYTLLHGYTDSIIRSVGLLPWHGFYHQTRSGHPTLASDLMEPFRHVVERATLSMIMRNEITPGDFTYTPAGACQLNQQARRKYLALLVQRFETPVKAIGEETSRTLFEHLHQQTLRFSQWIKTGGAFNATRFR